MIGSQIFFTQMQSYMSAPSVSDIACDNWYASAGCFFLALWQSVQAVWGIHGAMGGQYWAACACQLSLMVLDKDLWCWFFIILECLKPSVAHNTPSQFKYILV